jgi:hypothetical protein
MAVAMLYPETMPKGIKNIPASKQYVSHARTVLKGVPEIAELVTRRRVGVWLDDLGISHWECELLDGTAVRLDGCPGGSLANNGLRRTNPT